MLGAEQFAEHSDGGKLHLVPALNDDDEFIGAVAALVRKGPNSVDPHLPILPLCTSSEDEALPALISRLVMVGIVKRGRLEDPNELQFVDAACLRSLRRERVDLLESIQQCRTQPHVDGCFVFNTCQRSELYALVDHGTQADRVIPGLSSAFFERMDTTIEPISLKGREAYRHLLRAATGLNSTLPGDADVVEQLHSARLMAEHAQTLSPGLMRLLEEVDRTVKSIREETAWGSFMIDFAAAALSRLDLTWNPSETDGVIIGGSTTSRQLLRIIVEGRAIDTDRLTFAYRGTARKDLVKFIRRVAPHARRLRVDRYDDNEVVRAVVEADVVFLGIDSREPVLKLEQLERMRDFAVRPLTIVDFNSFGSTSGFEFVDGVRLIDAEEIGRAALAYGELQMVRPGFEDAFEEARRYVETAACAADWNPVLKQCANGLCEECSHNGHCRHASSSERMRGQYV